MSLRCLLVDDSDTFLASAASLLESQGIEVVGIATSGSQALALARSLNPDVALVDIELADEDGIELAEELMRQAPAAVVVLISAYEREDLTDLIGASPAVGFLPKSALGASAIATFVP